MAAGESSKTDPTEFIEQQRQRLHELKSSRSSAHNDADVDMHDEERTDSATKLKFEEEHFRNTPPNSALTGALPITTQPGFSNVDIKKMYPDYVNIEKDDYNKLIEPHESVRHGRLQKPCSC